MTRFLVGCLAASLVCHGAGASARSEQQWPAPTGAFAARSGMSDPVVRRGSQVPVIVTGQGFEMSSSGAALDDARPGERVRVRLGRRLAEGSALEDGRVRLRLVP